MLNSYIKSFVADHLSKYVEDFTSEDIVFDAWNGTILKENVKFKKQAFESIFGRLFGAPISVVQGYCKRLQVTVPWSQLMQKGIEILLEDVHLILKSTATYDRAFVKKTI
jgi:hypothetical protein